MESVTVQVKVTESPCSATFEVAAKFVPSGANLTTSCVELSTEFTSLLALHVYVSALSLFTLNQVSTLFALTVPSFNGSSEF